MLNGVRYLACQTLWWLFFPEYKRMNDTCMINLKSRYNSLFGFDSLLISVLYIYTYIIIRGSLNKFLDFFLMGNFIDSIHIKLYYPSKSSPPAAMHLLYRSYNLWKVLWKSSSVSVSMTFVTVSFISSIVSERQPLSLGNNQKSQGARSGL